MKRFKWMAMLLCCVLVLTKPMSVNAMEQMDASGEAEIIGGSSEGDVMPLWAYTDDVHLALSFRADTAYCTLVIGGANNATRIRANLWLYQKNSDGSWTILTGWRNMVVDDNDFFYEDSYSPVLKDETYKLYFTGCCYGPDGWYYDALAGEVIVTY